MIRGKLAYRKAEDERTGTAEPTTSPQHVINLQLADAMQQFEEARQQLFSALGRAVEEIKGAYKEQEAKTVTKVVTQVVTKEVPAKPKRKRGRPRKPSSKGLSEILAKRSK